MCDLSPSAPRVRAPSPSAPQSGLLGDMMTFCQKVQEAAEEWAQDREAAVTEELDSWLRHHRRDAWPINAS